MFLLRTVDIKSTLIPDYMCFIVIVELLFKINRIDLGLYSGRMGDHVCLFI